MLTGAIKAHCEGDNDVTVISALFDDSTGYGRIVRSADGSVSKIVEHKDANERELEIKEINSGMYIFKADALLNALGKLKNNNAQGEYYLTDTIEIIISEKGKAGAFIAPCRDDIMGVNDRVQLAEAERVMRRRINEMHMRAGVTITDPDNTYI
jgi:bifunctional UDP-N-acetylglucosamine pyrophosphorylase/glucosamine-1-phosphate N-acetyltransferase